MKIYTQNRERIVEMPLELRIVSGGTSSVIVGNGFKDPVLGKYTTARAKEVLREIFQYYRNGKNSYIMPLE